MRTMRVMSKLAVMMSLSSALRNSTMRTISAETAAAIDRRLMSPDLFSLEQLMELAGQSVGVACSATYPGARVLAVAGSGNNGGDALVGARWLRQFGHPSVDIYYPKRSDTPLFRRILAQAIASGCTVVEDMPSVDAVRATYDVVLDGVFGFSFRAPVRSPFDGVLAILGEAAEFGPTAEHEIGSDGLITPASPCRAMRRAGGGVAIVSIDVPSGWHVDRGDESGKGIRPSMLISLTAPKGCADRLDPEAAHWLAGRFIPPSIAEEFDLAGLREAYGEGTALAVKLK